MRTRQRTARRWCGARTRMLGLASALSFVIPAVGCGPEGEPGGRAEVLGIAELLAGADTAGYARADGPRAFDFPADHGPHPEYRHEWWYYVGNLTSVEDGREFGFQLTFFRGALASEARDRESAWATNQMYMAHFTVTDVAGGAFYAAERFGRPVLGLAGARASPFRVWLEDWSAAGAGTGAESLVGTPAAVDSLVDSGAADANSSGNLSGAGFEVPPFRLRARQDGAEIDLRLDRGKPLVLQGDDGWSRKGAARGNASYYYSFTRMPVSGTVRVDGRAFEVRGAAWMDREWGTSALPEGVVGWDWFALRLADGSELMLYRLRRADGAASAFSSGTFVRADGSSRRLRPADFQIARASEWRSPRTGVRYPSAWRVDVPGEELALTVEPLLRDQELDLSVRYWEGAVRVEGRRQGRPVRGRGYVEMTGYATGGAAARR